MTHLAFYRIWELTIDVDCRSTPLDGYSLTFTNCATNPHARERSLRIGTSVWNGMQGAGTRRRIFTTQNVIHYKICVNHYNIS